MPVVWNEDDPRDLPVIQENLRSILRQILRETPNRQVPTVKLARDWHRRIYQDVQLPVPYFAGGLRGENDLQQPELIDYEVMVGNKYGVPARRVQTELSRFEDSVQTAIARLDSVIPVGAKPEDRTEATP